MGLIRRIIFDLLFLILGVFLGLKLREYFTLEDILNTIKEWVNQLKGSI